MGVFNYEFVLKNNKDWNTDITTFKNKKGVSINEGFIVNF